MSIGRIIRGIRDKIPAGYVLGRAAGGIGPVQLLRVPGLAQPTGQGGPSSLATDADIEAAVAGLLSNALTNAHIFVGNASNVATDVAASGDLSLVASGAFTIANDAVSNAKLANMAAWSVKVRNAGSSGDPSDAALADWTEEASPEAGDFVMGFLASGELRKFDFGNVAAVGSWVPTVDGSEPPVFITDGAGVLIFTFYTP